MKKQTSIDNTKGQIILYKNKLEVRLQEDTVWLTQKQMLELFDTERSVITKHLRNILITKELEGKSVCAKIAHCKFRQAGGLTQRLQRLKKCMVITYICMV